MRVLLVEKALEGAPSGAWHVSGAISWPDSGTATWLPGFVDDYYSAELTLEDLWRYLEESGGNGYTMLVEVRPVDDIEQAVALVTTVDAQLRESGHPLGAFQTMHPVAVSPTTPDLDEVETDADNPCDQHLHVAMPLHVADVVSWQLLAQLVRRHPSKLWILRTYPMDGHYDCLSVRRIDRRLLGGASIELNRSGTHVFVGALGDRPELTEVDSGSMSWGDPLAAEDPRDWLLQLERRAGLVGPKSGLPASTPSSLAIRWIAQFLTINMAARERWTAWTIDQPADGDTHFESFPEARRWSESQVDGPYKVWFVGRAKDRRANWALSASGDLWNESGRHWSLSNEHVKGGSMTALVVRTAESA